MYPLQSFSLQMLRTLNASVANSIREKTDELKLIKDYFPESNETRRDLIYSVSHGLEDLRVWSIQIHNAIDIVKQRETTNAN